MTISTQDAMPARSKFVALGTSADGVAGLVRLVGMLPADADLTFAIAVDADPAQRELGGHLTEYSAMPVVQVTSPVVPEPNHIYFAPPGLDLMFTGEAGFAAVPRLDSKGAQCSVDRLFRSLAAEAGETAVGVVLCGSGTDGSIGLKLLKERGGITMAQTPGESMPDEMSRVAVATGLIDFVLPLEGIASHLMRTIPHALDIDADDAPEDMLRELLILLRVRTGHDFAHYKRATLFRRVARRMQVTGAADLTEYLRIARQQPSELASLLRDFMISVTNFFRDADAFEAVRTLVIPKLFEKNPSEPIRVWVAGCATGEEAYTLGMLLLEKRAEVDPTRQIQIFASDIDDDALNEARTGRYPSSISADVSHERLERFFTRHGDFYQVTKELRELVLFASHNVLRDAPFSRLDLVSCRNLLIYLDRTMQDNLLRTAHFALRQNGFLVLGSSENADTTEALSLFVPFEQKHRIYTRDHKVSVVIPRMGTKPRWAPPAFPPVKPTADLPAHVSGEVHHRLVERYAPPSLLVNERLEVIHVSQRANRYLQTAPGEPSRDLFQMVLPELRLGLRAAVYSAKRTPGVAVTCSARTQINGVPRFVRVGVQVETTVAPANANVLLWFEETDATPEMDVEPPNLEPQIEPVVQQLEEELRHTRDHLRTTIEQYETLVEELHASNEELQAINEELRSASEEIEASREETDSVNQELSAVNQELKVRVHETTAAKSDIANLMESSDVGVIFLDRDLRIHRFTQRMREIFNILDSDVGRPLTDLTAKIDFPTMLSDAERVLKTMTPIERELRGHDAHSYLVRTRPYRSLDDRIAGVVMTFIEITALRKIEDALRNKEAMLELAERAANAGVWELHPEARLRMSSQCHRLYGTPESTSLVAADDWTANVVDDDRNRLLELISDSDDELDVEFRVSHAKQGERWLWMLGRKTEPTSVLAGITLDVTAAHQARRALEDADRRKNEFIATLAHELRNPLTPLTLGLDILELASGDPEKVETARGLMERQVSQLRRLVDDLLDISRIQSGRLALRTEQHLSLAALLSEACEAVRPLVTELHHTLVVEVDQDVHIDGDRMRLGQVFVNLLTNAAKYTEPGGVITVTAASVTNGVTVCVSDTGVGIAAEALPRIFDVFVQAEPILTRARGGLGIGLSLVRQLVQLHGGSVTAHSDGPGKGSSFIVTLPVSKETASS